MKLSVINSVFLGTEVDPYSEGITMVKELGFDSIDICPTEGELNDAQIKSIIEHARRNDLPVTALTTILFGFFDPNRAARNFSIDLGKRQVDLTALLGAGTMQIVNGEYFWQLETGFDKSWIFGKAVEGTRAVGEHAAAVGVKIAIELEPFPMSIVNSIDAMDEFLRAVDLPETVLANVDCSHLFLAGILPKKIQRLKGRIAHVHISDAIDKHGDLPPGRGKAPLQDYIDQLKIAGFEGTVACELEWPPDPSRAGLRAWVGEAGQQTAVLLERAGVRRRDSTAV